MRTSVRAMIQRFANCKLHGHETPIRARAQSSSPFFINNFSKELLCELIKSDITVLKKFTETLNEHAQD